MYEIERKKIIAHYNAFKEANKLAVQVLANLGKRYRLANRLCKKLPDTTPSLVKISYDGARLEAWNAYQASKAVYNAAWQEYLDFNLSKEKANQELTENRKEGVDSFTALK